MCVCKRTRCHNDRFACSRSSMGNALKLECQWKDTRGWEACEWVIVRVCWWWWWWWLGVGGGGCRLTGRVLQGWCLGCHLLLWHLQENSHWYWWLAVSAAVGWPVAVLFNYSKPGQSWQQRHLYTGSGVGLRCRIALGVSVYWPVGLYPGLLLAWNCEAMVALTAPPLLKAIQPERLRPI